MITPCSDRDGSRRTRLCERTAWHAARDAPDAMANVCDALAVSAMLGKNGNGRVLLKPLRRHPRCLQQAIHPSYEP